MSFITSQQANIQGCKIETPHSQDIRDICGTSMCAGAPRENLFVGQTWVLGAGWTDLGGGKFQFTGGGNGNLTQVLNSRLTVGHDYQFNCLIETITGGLVFSRLSGTNEITNSQGTPGPYTNTQTLSALGADSTGFRADTGSGIVISALTLWDMG